MIAYLLIPLILALALFGEPLFVVISTLALVGFYFISEVNTAAILVEVYRLAGAPAIIAIPLFTFAGFIMAESKAPIRLVNLSRAYFGWMHGGLALVAIITCAAFTALTGASGVTIIALGGLLYIALMRDNYSEKFSLGLLTSSGSLGLLFPPSLPLIIYGLVASTSVDKLFLAGILPGLLIIFLLSLYCLRIGMSPQVQKTKFSLRKVYTTTREALWELPLPVIILGGIYGGVFTASEAAAVAATYAIVVEVFIYQDIKLGALPKIMRESMVLVGGILIILGAALGFTNFLVDQQVPMKAMDLIETYIPSRLVFLLTLNVFLLIVGCMMDMFSALVVVVPLILPIAKSYGVDPIHLGIIFLTNLEIGYFTPPVGINLFISSFRFRKPIMQLYRASLPFLLIMLLALLIITYYPDLSLKLVEISRAR